jgi:Tfp pilus assembly protein PilF
VAQVAGLDSLKVEAATYTAGFPKEAGFNFGKGIAVAVVNKRIIGDGGGYTVVYNAETLPGMSGGGVFDQNGRLVAIHGQGDRYRENTEVENISLGIGKSDAGNKIGYNRGIPVRWVVQGLKESGIILGQGRSLAEDRVAKPASVATADEFFITGFNKLEEPGADVPAGKREAISLLSKAITMKPSYAIAYFMRGFAYEQLQLDSKALADYNQAISLNLKDANVYIVRGRLKSAKLNDAKGALADYNQAISLNPKASIAYNNRGALKYEKLNDAQGAIADCNQAISLNPKFSLAYINRGFIKFTKLNDDQGALADFNQAISLNPRLAIAYGGRGALKYQKLKDPQGALADYNQALALNPKFAEIYVLRGMLKHGKFNDRLGGIADVRQAAKLARAQNNQVLQAATRQILESWGLKE